MSNISKEVISKLNQLSELLIIIRDSGNTTPQVLKELAVEKCSEITKLLECNTYNDLPQTPVDSDIAESSSSYTEEDITDKITEIEENSLSEDVDAKYDFEEEQGSIIFENKLIADTVLDGNTSEINTEDNVEYQSDTETESISEEKTDTKSVEVKLEIAEAELEPLEIKTSLTDLEFPKLVEENEEFTEEEEEFIFEQETDYSAEDKEDEGYISFAPTVDLLSTPTQNDDANILSHKKIRSVLSINDIFLYKRELFGNSDVDMCELFENLDNAPSFEEAKKFISEYFGDDNNDEIFVDFFERVKSCFE